MRSIANPAYDVVFKYLLEDRNVTKIFLSALLKREVVEVETRRNEYSNINRDNLTIYRVDFAAKVKESDGSVRLILIELQKTWVETETLRFRQYLGAQYSSPHNLLMDEGGPAYGMPMVTVYILGHRIGQIEEPVLYVKRKAYDYEGNEVTRGMPDPFVESLTHDSIIVQIPLLKRRSGNRLDTILSIFDQSLTEEDRHIMSVDDSAYENDSEMMAILHRLTAAAADAKMRHEMNVEDEYFSAIERRETEILARDRKLAEQSATITEQSATITQQSATITEQSATITEQSATITEREATIAEQSKQMKEKDKVTTSLIRKLLKSGADFDEISSLTGLAASEIERLMKTE